MSVDPTFVVTSKALLDQVRILVSRSDASPESLRHLVQNVADAFSQAPAGAPSVAVEVRDGMVHAVVTNFDCDAIVADYDVSQDSDAINVPHFGGFNSAGIYTKSCRNDAGYLKELGHLARVLDCADEAIPYEGEASYRVETSQGTEIRVSGHFNTAGFELNSGSDEFTALNDAVSDITTVELSWRDDTNTITVVSMSGDWHRDAVNDGVLDQALFHLTNGVSPTAAVQDAMEAKASARP